MDLKEYVRHVKLIKIKTDIHIYVNLVEKNLKQEIKIKKHVVKHALQILDTLKSI